MIDIALIRENPDLVRENIKKKFQDKKLPLVDEVLALDSEKARLTARGRRKEGKAQHPFKEHRRPYEGGPKRTRPKM